MSPRRLVLSTRSSKLALWQAERTSALLRKAHPGLEVELLRVRSTGDVDQESSLQRFGRIGIFTVEVDRAVLDGRAHAGVHSLKDMTTTLQEGVRLAAVLERGPVEDVFVGRAGETLGDLSAGARVATGSLRRRAMLNRMRSDVRVCELRGNVGTRLDKLAAGEAEGMILARAGLERLGLVQHIHQVFTVDEFLPAVGQAIVGVTSREGDAEVAELLRPIACARAFPAALAERAFLRAIRGGCNVPVGAHATLAGDELSLSTRILAVDGSREIDGCVSGSARNAEDLGEALAADVLERGAAELIAAARSET